MLVSISFSAVIYKVLSGEFQRFAHAQRFRIENHLQNNFQPPPDLRRFTVPPNIEQELLTEADERLIVTLAFINFFILIFAGGIGYFLSGRTLKPIQEMVDEQNRFISDASHELKTPLSSLKTAFEVSLRDKNLNLPAAKKTITESIVDVDQLSILSENLLTLARHQNLKDSKKIEKVSLEKILIDAVAKILPVAKQKKIIVKTKIGNYKIEGAKEDFLKLFVIILDNAVKYSPKKTEINLASQKTDNHVLIMIKDQGIGIDKKDLPHIFDRFFRADSARSKNEAYGHGLGLSIAREIIKAHHGSISAESKLNEGTTFIIRLPIKNPSSQKGLSAIFQFKFIDFFKR